MGKLIVFGLYREIHKKIDPLFVCICFVLSLLTVTTMQIKDVFEMYEIVFLHAFNWTHAILQDRLFYLAIK